MQNHDRREQIPDAMQGLMSSSNAQAIFVSNIAQKTGIGKGSTYYYFSSKNDIADAVIERSYPHMLDVGKELAASSHVDAFKKMELIYHACLGSSTELRCQGAIGTLSEQQESALIHQKSVHVIITRLKPILADITRQGTEEGIIHCKYPEEITWVVLTVLIITLDSNLTPADQDQIGRIPTALTQMQEKGMGIPAHTPEFMLRKN